MRFGVLKAASVAVATTLAMMPGVSYAQEKVSYLFPAPDFLPAFTPFQVAREKGYYEDAGLEVSWAIGKGGADVAKQVAAGNSDLGGGIGDTPIIIRPNGLDVKAVAVLGGKALTQLVIRNDSGASDVAGLRDKSVGVMAFQDTTYYNLLAALASEGMGKDDVNIQAVGPAGMVQLMISGDLQAISGTPDWAAAIEGAGVDLTIVPINDLFPAMAQAILASDEIIAERPEVVAGFVQATLKGMRDVMEDPEGSSKLLAENIPQFEGKAAMLEDIMKRYTELVYATEDMTKLGMIDPDRMASVAEFYKANEIVTETLPVEDYYDNQFAAPAD